MSKSRRFLSVLCLSMATAVWDGSVSAQSATPARPASGAPPGVLRACDLIADILSPVPGVKIDRSPPSAAREDSCEVHAGGTFAALRSAPLPTDRIADELRARGWNCDQSSSADGPDGTAFAMTSGTILCHVRGSWDGGDDSDPTYVPADWYRVVVACRAAEIAAGPAPSAKGAE